jgi:hypothetical protein
LIDVMPTLLDVAGAPYPKEFDGESIPPLDGISLRPAFTGEPLAREDSIFIEHENNAFVRSGKWKLVGRGVAGPNGTDQAKWELYDMAKDRTETNDLAEQLPQRKAKLAAKWDEWAQRVGVYPKPSKKKQTKKKTSRARTSQVLRDSRDNVIRSSSAKQPKAVTAASATLRLATYGYAAEGVNLILVLADDLGKTYVPSIPEGRSKFGSITKPLFADPNYNGSCDPEIIWNPAKQEWFIYYTARRATRATATYVGTPLGVITSPDLVNWTFRDYCSFDGKKGEPDNDDTHWAPGIILAGDRLHMYATYKGSAKPPWGGDGVIRHYVAPVDDPIDGWKLLEVPKFNQPDPIDVSFLQMAELKVDNGKLVCDRDADVVLRQKDGTAKNQPSGVSPRFPNNKRSRTDNRSLTSRG